MEKRTPVMIPKNFEAKFEIVPKMGAKDALFFIPSIITDILVCWLIPVSVYFKIIFVLITLFIPFCLVFIRPVKETIPGWKHIVWAIKFKQRQKVFYNRKGVEIDESKEK